MTDNSDVVPGDIDEVYHGVENEDVRAWLKLLVDAAKLPVEERTAFLDEATVDGRIDFIAYGQILRELLGWADYPERPSAASSARSIAPTDVAQSRAEC